MQQILTFAPRPRKDVSYVFTVNYIGNQVCTPSGTPIDASRVMRVAIAHWQDRVSPVFDSATRVLLVDVAEGRESGRADLPLAATDPAGTACVRSAATGSRTSGDSPAMSRNALNVAQQ
jgi:hypothetical protein